MDTYNHLESVLRALETAQFTAIRTAVSPGSLPATAIHGGVQSVVLDCTTKNETQNLPVIATVGINYYQSTINPTCPMLTPWLGVLPGGGHRVTDNLKAMRRALDFALRARQRNEPAWLGSHAARPPPSSTNYHLIALNFSPFITLKRWALHTTGEQNAILTAWPQLPHMAACFSRAGALIDTWVAHGKDYVWGSFDQWQRTHGLTAWMRTYNLGYPVSIYQAHRRVTHPLHSLYK